MVIPSYLIPLYPRRPATVGSMLLCLGLLLWICLPNTTQAQRRGSGDKIITAYPVAGACVAQMEGDELKGFDHWGFTGGVGAMITLTSNQRWQLGVEALYSQRGIRNTTVDPYAITGMNMSYADIPVLLHYTDPYGGMTFGLGLCYSRLVQQPHGYIYTTPAFMPDTSDMSFLSNDLSVAADMRFPVWRNLMLNFRVMYSLLPVKKDWQFTDYTIPSEPITLTHNCYNISVSMRLLWMLGDPPTTPSSSKKHKSTSKKHHK